MTKILPLLGTLLALPCGLAACHGPTPTPRATTAEQDIAMVEQAQHSQPPVQPITPQPVSFADADVPGRDVHLPHSVAKPHAGEGCSFLAAGQRAPTFVAVPQFGLVRHDGEWETFASDSGAERVSGNLPIRYSSGRHTLQLVDGAAGPDTLIIADKYGRVVYKSAGELRCKS